MGSAVLNKPPSPFVTFIYCFLLISFIFYIPHRIVALDEGSRASRVGPGPLRRAPNAFQQGPPKQSSPTQKTPESIAANSLNRQRPVVNCGRGNSYSECLPNQNSKGGKH